MSETSILLIEDGEHQAPHLGELLQKTK